ncbi:Eukaryotic peptide chain release factor GTP-binding subunit [Saxophila tyrrhenica]|uniref:Palmitoyltransferase n=1 Tax=Saxophila tyrrhenica TaxID=1690608 RepID=A0AAV9NWK7_9PEZI|nr:Eukaryotic peptide chain release factor GTP-binding subunit [Saxophila tyrrhenica]
MQAQDRSGSGTIKIQIRTESTTAHRYNEQHLRTVTTAMSAYSEDGNAPTSALPTFLDSDPYPSSGRDGAARPASSASAATDATSEYGTNDDFKSAKERQSNMTTLTGPSGPVGEPGLPPSRPTTASTTAQSVSQRGKRSSLQAPTSRRGFAMFAAGRGGGGSDAGSRPTSASTGRTHVPGVAAQGFFRPMSSSKLQAQRNQRPASALGQNVETAEDERQARRRRYSNASLNTLRDAPPPKEDEADIPPLPVSRGTDGQPEDNTAASVTSATPLHNNRHPNPPRLEVSGLRASTTPNGEKAPKSPSRSFRASLGIGSRASKHSQQDRRVSPTPQHEKLESHPSSPRQLSDEKAFPSSHQPQQSAKGNGKNYEYAASNTLFFLAGRCLNTRAKPLNVATFLLTVLPAVLFFAFSAPWLWLHVSPAIPIIFAYIFYITLSSFLHAALSDPGILPRNMHPHPPNPDEERDPLTVGPPTTEWVMVKTFPSTTSNRVPLPVRDATSAAENGIPAAPSTAMEVPTKYCKSCAIWRPPRAHHCRVCDACIETQDHHCVWLNNCVGRRNYRFFFSYVAFATLLAFLLLAFSLTHVGLYAQQHDISFRASLAGRTQERMAFAMFIYCVLALPYPGSLFAYHLFLIARGETTREYLNTHKFPKKDRHRPFSQATLVQNWVSVLVRPRPPSYMQFKKRYEAGDQRLGHTAPKKERRKDLRNRYSVQGTNGTTAKGANGSIAPEGHEMKQLPPLPPPSSHGQQGVQLQGPSNGGGGVVGAANSTPR